VSTPRLCCDTRTNRAEAEAVVKEIVTRLSDVDRKDESIGVVTFSQAQQDLVENLLDEARRTNPVLEPFFDIKHPEPVFVKNLENVQGDERDVILFSIAYGPDASGRISMNFGPLNRDGGERRLNVAITRAKREVMIFSTLRPEQIDLSRSKAQGVADLKAYLEYAQKGPRALGEQIASAHTENYESPFEEEVGAFLMSKGFELHTQVGCSGYRLDMAILDPKNPGHYLVGIECDGATYHRAATSRDRDRLRHLILEGLGWRIVRVWSTDWWRGRPAAEERLLNAIQEAIETGEITKPEPLSVEPPVERPHSESETQSADPSAQDGNAQASNFYPAPAPAKMVGQDEFYEISNRPILADQIHRIVRHEGPITESLLIRRVQDEWDFGRAGSRIKSAISAAYPADIKVTHQNGDSVFWPTDLDPASYDQYRVPDPSDPDTKRSLDQIPIEELRNAMRHLIAEYMSLPMDDLFRETLKVFGGKQLSKTARARFEQVFKELSGEVVCE
jgi:very-short-patch-repair endonuclease